MKGSKISVDFRLAQDKFPELRIISLANKTYSHKVSGDFEILDQEGHNWGAFPASIYIHNSYPKGFPTLQDESREFPWTDDWHIDPMSGACCVCSPLESIEVGYRGINLLNYIDQYVLPFYANQIYKREFGDYKNGEYSHHEEGAWEALEEELNIYDRNQLKKIAKGLTIKYKRNAPCLCGSGMKSKKCHGPRIRYIKELALKLTLQ